jgi:ribose transport system ATP-binding protein
MTDQPPAAARPILEMRGIRKQFPGVLALAGVDFTLEAGEVHMLLGENGAGKSTLMKILSGAVRRDAGVIRIDGRDADVRSPRDALDLGIRVIYQELALVPHLSVAENIFLGALPTRGPGLVDWRRLTRESAGLLADLGVELVPSTPLARLRLAERQMVEIARTLAGDRPARILVMDEPTSALTAREVDRLFELITRLSGRGVGTIYITHRLDEVFRIGQRVTVLRDGCHLTTTRVAEVGPSELVRLMANREITEHFPRLRTAPGAELLRVEHLTRAGVVTDVSFSLRAGEILGIGGLAGSGRSELARVLAGADRHDSGRIFIEGRPVTIRSPASAIRQGIGLLPEDRKTDGLVADMTVAGNVALPHEGRLARFGFLTRRREEALAHPVVRDLRIHATPAQPVRLLSGGNQQKVVLGRWLAGDARILILDEPTRGVDVGTRLEICHVMNRLTARGAGVIMISSDLPELVGMSDRILVMYRGRVHAELDRALATEERVLRAALGLAS